MTNLDNIFKSRDITLPTNICIVKVVFVSFFFFFTPIVMYGCEGWIIKNAEHWRIGAFQLCCWRRLLRVPWTGSRSNQSILKEINLEYLLERLKQKFMLQYFTICCKQLTMEKAWKLHKIEGWKRKGQQRVKWLDSKHYWINGHE